MRGDVGGQGTALVVRLAHEAHVAEPQVAEPAVDELGRRARRARPEVPGVDEGHGEPRAGRVGGGRRADHAPADDEQIERPTRERLACGGPPLDRRYCGHSGFVHARPPAGSTTSSRAKGAVSGRSSRAARIQPSCETSRISAPYR